VSEKTLYNKLNRYAAEARQQGTTGNLIKAAEGGGVGSGEIDLR